MPSAQGHRDVLVPGAERGSPRSRLRLPRNANVHEECDLKGRYERAFDERGAGRPHGGLVWLSVPDIRKIEGAGDGRDKSGI